METGRQRDQILKNSLKIITGSQKAVIRSWVAAFLQLKTLAILICELLSVSTLQNNMTTQARNFVEAQAGTNANVVNEWLVEEGNIVHTIRNGVAFMNTKDTDQIMDYLEVNLAENEDALMYYVCFAYDGGVFPADHSKLDLDPTTRDWWKMAIAKDGLIYTAPYKDFASGQMIVTIAEPMKIQGEQAVFLADITIDTLTQIVGNVSTEDSIQAFLLDADGNVVSHANEDFLPKEEGNTVLADAVAGVNKNLQEITYSSENMSTETKSELQSIGKLQQNMQQFRV